MRDEWSADFYPLLAEAAQAHDIKIYRHRSSGFWEGAVEPAYFWLPVPTPTGKCAAGILDEGPGLSHAERWLWDVAATVRHRMS